MDRQAQRKVERDRALLAGNEPLGGAAGPSLTPIVRDSWNRSRVAGVPLELRRAPVALAGDQLALAVQRTDWLPVALDIACRVPGASNVDRHVLTLFDADGRMLASEGDPQTVERLGDINFAPGGLWEEGAVGTNGPGTALALGRPVHVVGAEHYCEAWQPWHCAAAPIRDPGSQTVLGALDLTGPLERADPRRFDLVRALAFAIERALSERELQRRCRILQLFSDLVARYPSEVVVAVDRYGQVLSASPAAPPEFHPGRETEAPVRRALAALVAEGVGGPGDFESGDGGWVVYPVVEGAVRIGGSLLLRRSSRPHGHPRERHRRPTRYSFLDLIGQSRALSEASRIAGIAAANTLPVLLLGESGVGKELFAQSIHSASERRDCPFIPVNCGAIPSELIESELFGYVGGAYSGARREGSPGKFQAADGGTLFLDEIAELPPGAQTALLRALQEGEVTRVGETHSRPVDVRIIAATNRDIETAVEEGRLRADLYYRLAVLTIELPPLRQRREDIALLAQHFLDQTSTALGRQGLTLDSAALAALAAYHWPGNVRELQNAISQAAALATGSRLSVEDLPASVRGDGGVVSRPYRRAARPAPDRTGKGTDEDRARLLGAISSCTTMAEAAETLGITRSTLYRRLRRCGLQPRRIFTS